ncbi:MAG: hypothetical protein WC490_08150, partial [Candidatus Margulisiibacteriota bacterium]
MFSKIDLFNKKNKYGLKDNSSILVDNTRLDPVPFADPLFISRLFKRFVNKKLDKFRPDKSRVITRYLSIRNEDNIRQIIKSILAMKEEDAVRLLVTVMKDFESRHKDLKKIFVKNYAEVSRFVAPQEGLSAERKLLIGSYFTMEYSVESTALFNPSVVVYPKQNDLKKGQTRVIFSFRATGEGHISSIVFRSAIMDSRNEVYLEPISRFVSTPQVIVNPTYDKALFERKLKEIHSYGEVAEKVTGGLKDEFTYNDLKEEMEKAGQHKFEEGINVKSALEQIKWLADCNYEVVFPAEQLISERVIFPVSQTESNGIEDARFVRFAEEDGSVRYYATYTAYNGREILPQLMETRD